MEVPAQERNPFGFTGRTFLASTPPRYGDRSRPREDGLEPLGLELRPSDPKGEAQRQKGRLGVTL